MKSLLAALLVAFVTLTGCRDYIVSPEIEDVAPRPDVPELLLKGPNEITVGVPYLYKVDGLADVSYSWSAEGPDGFSGSGDGTRFYRGVAQRTGPGLIKIAVLDITGTVVGYSERRVEVMPEVLAAD